MPPGRPALAAWLILGIACPWPAVAEGDVDRFLAVKEGFVAELVHAVTRDQGSWVSLAVDGRGRLVAGAEAGGLYRLTPAPAGAPATGTRVETLETSVGGTQGLLFVEGDLYCVVNDGRGEGSGLYRLRDTDGDDRFDECRLLRGLPGGEGEHGPHGVALGPDGLLYVVAGNHTPLPDLEASAVPRVWGEDHLLPRLWDAGGHAVGILAPGGWIGRTDREGRGWELVASGFRNPYDLAFNVDGEVFTYDADMEWDLGAPWYRPTRVNHVTSGAEFGWRSGTAKWPPHYPDSLPAVLDIGPGSPTGVLFGYGAAFPARDRDALYLLDWTYGTIYAVHLEPDGASYRATRETFLTGRPLPLTDAVINPADGAMYFAVGGRGTASAVYRVRYAAEALTVAPPEPAAAGAVARDRRRRLEAWHRGGAPAEAIDSSWAALDDPDRFIRSAARIALEHQPPSRWADRAVEDAVGGTRTTTRARLAALLALARVGGAAWRDRMIETLDAMPWVELTPDEQLELLRVWSLCFIRTGPPDEAVTRRLRGVLEPAFPTGDDRLDAALCDLLVYIQSGAVVPRAIALMERGDREAGPEIDAGLLARGGSYGEVILRMAAAQPQRQQVHYALALRHARRGWTSELRARYFRWFETARRMRGGVSFAGYLDAIRSDAIDNLPASLRPRYETLGLAEPAGVDPAHAPRGPGRPWTVAALLDLAAEGLEHRSHGRGRALFDGARCAACHRFSGSGRQGGPDLTGVASRFTIEDLIGSIVEPSATISDQYRNDELVLDDGTVRLGRVVAENAETLRLMPSLLAPGVTIEVPIARVHIRRPSPVSPMTPYLLDGMTPGEVLDLLAYLLSEGDHRAAMFAPAGASTFRRLDDGRSLAGWSGDPSLWSVEDDAIVGRTSPDHPLARNAFLVLEEPLPEDFELRAEVLLRGDNNSGLQYRSLVDGEGRVTGAQCDIHPNPAYDGMLYEEGGRGIVARQGERIRILPDERRVPLAPGAEPIAFAPGLWREYAVIARGDRVEHRIDGTLTCLVIDESDRGDRPRGRRLALQLHTGPAYEVRFRRVRVRQLAPAGR